MLVCLFIKFKKGFPGKPPTWQGLVFLTGQMPALWDTIHVLACSWGGGGDASVDSAESHYQGSSQELWGVLSCWVPPKRPKSQAIFCGFT